MKKFSLVIVILSATLVGRAQNLDIVATSGEYHENSFGSLSWKLGGACIETLIVTNFILTQGFQQSKLTVTYLEELHTQLIELAVYPNPTNSFLTIEVKSENSNDINLKMIDLNGILFLQTTFTESF